MLGTLGNRSVGTESRKKQSKGVSSGLILTGKVGMGSQLNDDEIERNLGARKVFPTHLTLT